MVFFSLGDLNRAIREQLDLLNNKLLTNRSYSRRQLFVEEEKLKLESLPKERFQRKTYRESKVNKDAHLWIGLDKHYYSVPYSYVGKCK